MKAIVLNVQYPCNTVNSFVELTKLIDELNLHRRLISE